MNLFYHRNMFHTSHNTNELLMYLLRMGSPIRDAICKHLLPLTIIELRYFIHPHSIILLLLWAAFFCVPRIRVPSIERAFKL